MKSLELMHERNGIDPDFFQINKEIIKKYGIKAALWLACLHEIRAELIINDFEENLISKDDYIHAAQEDIEEKTGITPDIQRRIIKLLKENGIIKVKRQGIPAKNYYWINEKY